MGASQTEGRILQRLDILKFMKKKKKKKKTIQYWAHLSFTIQRLFYGGTGLCRPQIRALHDRIDHDVIEGLDLISILNKIIFFKTFLTANDNLQRKHHDSQV